MINFKVKFDARQFERELNKIRKERVPVAMANALNRAADSVATSAARQISKATKIPVREVRQRIKIKRASRTMLVAEVLAFPYAPNLKKFRPNQNKVGVAASAWERRKTYRHAFIHPKTGGVVTRTTNKRFPLKGLRGPSVPKTFQRTEIIKELEKVARQTWRSRIEREIARELRASL